jgi:signal transduction histidine kinase
MANNILNSDEKIIYNPPKKHHFNEIKKLEQALLKINDYKIELKDTNNQLTIKTDEHEKLIKSQANELQKFSRAYELKDNMQKHSITSTNFNPNAIIQECLDMIYPEIYSRQIIVENEIKEIPKINIPQNIFIQIMANLLSRSFIFCKENDKINLSNNYTEINNIDYVSIMIEDCGVGDESFRKDILKSSCTAEETIRLIQEHNGFFKFIDQEDGVKY